MYYLFVLGKILASLFPRNFCYLVAKFISILHFYVSKKDRETVAYNLYPIVKGKKEARRYIKEVFINFSYYLVDFFRYKKLDRNFIKKYVKVEGLENLSRSHAKGKGVILITAHFGNYELAGAVTSLLGYSPYAVALPHKDKRINKLFDNQRRMMGVEVISAGTGAKSCFSVLKNGGILALLGDRNFSGVGLKSEMFSRQAYFPRGVAFFALKADVDIVPCFLIRENKFFYRFVFDEPITHEGCSQRDEAVIVSKYISVFEKYIQKYPSQWYMFEKYWL